MDNASERLRLIFMLTGDKQPLNERGYLFQSLKHKLYMCLREGQMLTLCIAILAVGPLAFAKPTTPL
jgi:hypothetical protein